MQQQDSPSLPPPPPRFNLFESIIEAIVSLFRRSPPVNYPSGVVYEKRETPYSSIYMYLIVGVVLAFVGFLFVWAFSANLVAQGSGILGVLGVTLAGSIAPLVYAFWMYYNDRFEREPLALVAYTFGWGAFSGIPAALINTVLLAAVPAAYIVAPLVEEPLKIIGIYYLVAKSKLGKEFNNHLDGMVYGAAAGAGFAAVENFSYIARSVPFDSVLAAILIRSCTPLMHAFCTGYVGRWLGLSKVRQGQVIWLAMIPGFVVAMLVHGLWNFLGQFVGLLGLVMLVPIAFWMYKFPKEASQDETSWGYATGAAPKE
jgi:RsiW-degrading membrane proteinase PrsW (M82 family)